MVQEAVRGQAQVRAQQMFRKIFLLPAVQGFVKRGLKRKIFREGAFMQQAELFHGPDVAETEFLPGFASERQEIVVSQVFRQGCSAARA